MTVNVTAIYNATSIVAQNAVLSQQTGYIFGICVVMAIGLIAFFRASNTGLSNGLLYGVLYSFLTCVPLWLFGWMPYQALLITLCLLAAVYLFKRFTEE